MALYEVHKVDNELRLLRENVCPVRVNTSNRLYVSSIDGEEARAARVIPNGVSSASLSSRHIGNSVAAKQVVTVGGSGSSDDPICL